MRVLTGLFLLLVASACGGSQPAASPPPATEPAPALQPAASASAAAQPAPTTAPEEHAAPAETKPTAESGGTQSIFAVLKVKDPKAFVTGMAGMRADLEKASVFAYVIAQGQDQTDTIIAHLIGHSGEKLKAFIETEKAKSGGLFKTTDEFFVAQDDAYQVPNPWPEQQTFDVFLRFKVKDYEKWRAHFDSNGEVRAASGIIGYGMHHSLSDERVIVHYLAKSTDLLRQIASMPEVSKVMKEQGVKGSPKPFYATNIAAQSLKAK